jgi:hypothetical protein
MTPVPTFWQRCARRRFALLFAVLLVALVGHPLLEFLSGRERAIEWLLAAALAVAVVGVEAAERTWALLALAICFAVLRLADGLMPSPVLFGLGHALWALACALAAALLVRHALRRGPVDAERIFAALDAYLLAAAAFGVAYWILDRTWPTSIGPDLGGAISTGDGLYLSLVTITTVGFGDLVPASGVARGLATLEAVAGQTYLVVLVARLVSLYSLRHEAAAREPAGD